MCNELLGFRDDIRSEGGRRIPFDISSGRRHDCHRQVTEIDEERLISQTIEYVRQVNFKLTIAQLRLVREDKQ